MPLRHARDARGVHRLTLDEPARLNVLSNALLAELACAIEEVASDQASRVVVIAASGKAFCAGHDLRELVALNREDQRALFERCSRVMLALHRLEVPVVAAVQGVAAAAGCQLVAQCDLAVATTEARFGVNGIDVGLFCSTPAVPLLRSVPWKTGVRMLMTGQFLDAHAALQAGLVSELCAPEALEATVEAMVSQLLAKPREALALGKALIARQRHQDWDAAYALATHTMVDNLGLPATVEGIAAFLDKRLPAWRQAPTGDAAQTA